MCEPRMLSPARCLQLAPPCLDGFSKLLDHVTRIGSSEDGAPSNNHVGAGIGSLVDGLSRKATIDLDVKFRILRTKGGNLWQLGSHERLATKTRLDCHDEDHLSVC